MDETPSIPPVILTLSGHDPVGGAGIQADIEAIVSQGCHPTSIITCLTVQDTCNVKRVMPIADYLLLQQAEALQSDIPIAAIKVGLLGSVDVVLAVEHIIQQFPNVPVILDPILAAGGGAALSNTDLINAICEHLLPLTTLVTPNLPELQRLAPKCVDTDEQALCLLAQGAAYVLVTGTHGDTQKVENVLYGDGKRLRTWSWERLPETYHGSGCTLAATCAANLAKGQDIATAVGTAQAYTWGSLQAGRKVGHCQWLPNRLYWANAC